MRRWLAAATAAVLIVPALATAQEGEGEERGQLMEVITWHVTPDQSEAWEAAVAKLVEAAEEAGLADQRWAMWSEPTSYTLVYPVDSFGYFDDPEEFARSFRGTPGEARFGEAMTALQAMPIVPLAVEVTEVVDDWSYRPADASARFGYAHLDEIWIRPGKMEEFGALAEDWAAMLEEVDYAYPSIGHRVHLGAPRFVFVTLVDDLASYYGENALAAAVEGAGAGERFGDLLERFEPVLYKLEHRNMTYEPSLSYWPTEETASN